MSGESTPAVPYWRLFYTGLVFLTFEGGDGCGKSTQLDLLAARLEAEGYQVVRAQEPGGTRAGAQIRRILLDARSTDLGATAELLLYFASRAQNVEEVIRPALEVGRIVVADRFTDASMAYQGCGRGLGGEAVEALERIACRGLRPDLTFWIDLDIETGLRRALSRNTGVAVDESRFERESLEFHRRVRQGYAAIQAREPERVVRLDGDRPAEVVAAEIWGHAERLLAVRHV